MMNAVRLLVEYCATNNAGDIAGELRVILRVNCGNTAS